MNREPIHKNLSTSFVDLEALVNHLKDLQFVGSIHLELSSYEADIIFTAPQKIQVREYGQQAGIKMRGSEALKRIFERAREPFGRIHVYRSLPSANTNSNDVYVDEVISTRARRSLTSNSDTPAFHLLSNAPATERPEYSSVIAELLQTLQTSLRNAHLDFPEAFRNTCASLSAIYPFLNPKLGTIRFKGEAVELDICVDTKQFTDALIEVLGIIISRVAELAKRSVAIDGVQSGLQAFAARRRKELDRLGLGRLPDLLLDQI